MIAATIKDRIHREPFEPFIVRSSSGVAYPVTNPDLVAMMKSEVFIATENSDKWVSLPYLHIAAVEAGTNGHSKRIRKGSAKRK